MPYDIVVSAKAARMLAEALRDERNWFKLPLKLRQQYWRETQYGRTEPSEELMVQIRSAIEEICK